MGPKHLDLCALSLGFCALSLCVAACSSSNNTPVGSAGAQGTTSTAGSTTGPSATAGTSSVPTAQAGTTATAPGTAGMASSAAGQIAAGSGGRSSAGASGPGDGAMAVAGSTAVGASGASGAPSSGTGAPAAGMGASGAGMGASAAGAMAPAAGGCTRESLKALIDSYFKAMAAHDPSPLPKVANLKFTENAKTIQLGDGLWKTAGMPVFTRNVLDTQSCGTVTEAVVAENSGQVIFGLRLKLDAEQKLSEVETFVVRSGGFAFKPQGIVDSKKDDWETVLDQSERTSKEDMNAAANGYFDLFSKPNTKVPFGMPCYRIENGTLTTPGGDCGSGIPAGNLQMTHRRFPVVDLEAGITVGWVLFGGSLLDFHMFKFKSGKVQFINAVVGPGATSSGWD